MIRNIPTSNTLQEAALKAGYAPSTAKSDIYKLSSKSKIRQDLAKAGYSKESLKAEFDRIALLCETERDYSNMIRALENIQKYHLRDTSNAPTAIFNLDSETSARLRDKIAPQVAPKSIDDKELEQ